MAPPTPVLTREEVAPALANSRDCVLASLTQNECHFDGRGYVCVPFQRLFRECTLNKRRVRIEITERNTNM
ncbi:AaceriACR014Cp [[Ashbya] aceris (nom. inval.)]|nr:AaceriACR014Cp [[Ashbya] aceris (nom. inval.)]